MKNFWLAVCFLGSINHYCQTIEIKGYVFDDANGNNIRDEKELGIPQVVVSDQSNTTTTNEDGAFKLVTKEDIPFLFISLPNGYLGITYYAQRAVMNFPLKKSKDQREFKFIHASDTHIDSLNLPRMGRFRQMADSLGADFVLISGDLIRDALRTTEEVAVAYYELYLSEIAKFKMPVYSAVGNHELFGIERDKSLVSADHPLYGKKMFKKYLGPDYYSFNYGGIHFVSLDAVDYQNLYYYGGVDTLQLAWLARDLSFVPQDTPIITFNHIPFVSPGFSFQNYDNDIFYGPQLLVQEGKLAHRHIVYNFEKIQKIIGDRPFPLALSGHYHAAQEGRILGSDTRFVQTSAITRPDTFDYNGFQAHSGFTLYRIKDGKIVSSTFIPLVME